MISLSNDDFELALDPDSGALVAAAFWCGEEILRSQTNAGDVLSSACFPLVPFSNRIAGSRFDWRGRRIELVPNHPGDTSSPAIHGVGWLSSWTVTSQARHAVELHLAHQADRHWPWDIEMRQNVTLEKGECRFDLELHNTSDEAMPAGLGFHPYFPRNQETLYRGLHTGEWQNDDGCIPVELQSADSPEDWWNGQPVGTRHVDTVYTQRSGPLVIEWPDRGIGLEILPGEDLPFTTVYVPRGEDFFCVEPVSHMTDAFNRSGPDTGMRVLEPGEEWSVSMRLKPYAL